MQNAKSWLYCISPLSITFPDTILLGFDSNFERTRNLKFKSNLFPFTKVYFFTITFSFVNAKSVCLTFNLKYVFSIDINNFLEKARKIAPSIQLINNNEEEFDLVFTIKNRGYDSTNYKTKITVNDKIQKYSDEYYITAVNEFKEWNITVSNANEKPKDW